MFVSQQGLWSHTCARCFHTDDGIFDGMKTLIKKIEITGIMDQ